MIKDRKSKKWVSLMFPEHVNALREWGYATQYHEEKPTVSDHQLEMMDNILMGALNQHRPVEVQYYNQMEKRMESFRGTVDKVDPLNGVIKLSDETKTTKALSVKDILDVRLT